MRAESLVVGVRQRARVFAAFSVAGEDEGSEYVPGSGIRRVGAKSLNWSFASRGGRVVSHRTPRLSISFELTRQSSWK